MKYCSSCGAAISNDTKICPHCGNHCIDAVVVEGVSQETNGMAIAGFVLSFFSALLGLIFSSIGLGKSEKLNGSGKGLSIAGLVLSIVTIALRLPFLLIFIR